MTTTPTVLGAGHLAELVALEQRAQPLPWTRAQLAEELSHESGVVHGVFEGEGLAGYAAWRQQADELWLLNLAVQPSSRRHGLGLRLVRAGHPLAVARAATSLWLEVRASNAAARTLYERAGFVVAAQRRGYYRPLEDGGAREDAVLMRAAVEL